MIFSTLPCVPSPRSWHLWGPGPCALAGMRAPWSPPPPLGPYPEPSSARAELQLYPAPTGAGEASGVRWLGHPGSWLATQVTGRLPCWRVIHRAPASELSPGARGRKPHVTLRTTSWSPSRDQRTSAVSPASLPVWKGLPCEATCRTGCNLGRHERGRAGGGLNGSAYILQAKGSRSSAAHQSPGPALSSGLSSNHGDGTPGHPRHPRWSLGVRGL